MAAFFWPKPVAVLSRPLQRIVDRKNLVHFEILIFALRVSLQVEKLEGRESRQSNAGFFVPERDRSGNWRTGSFADTTVTILITILNSRSELFIFFIL